MANMCQSCGMPLSKDKNGGGTNADGSKSDKYCSLCYANGEFYTKNMSVTEFQDFCIQQMKKQGMPGPIAWLFTRGIPKLERWRNT